MSSYKIALSRLLKIKDFGGLYTGNLGAVISSTHTIPCIISEGTSVVLMQQG